MMTNEDKARILENRIKVAESKGSSGNVVRHWRRELRNLRNKG